MPSSELGLSHELAEMRLATLVEYGRPAALDQAKARVDAAHDELGRREQSVESQIAQRRAALDQTNGRVQEIEARIEILEGLAAPLVRAALDQLANPDEEVAPTPRPIELDAIPQRSIQVEFLEGKCPQIPVTIGDHAMIAPLIAIWTL